MFGISAVAVFGISAVAVAAVVATVVAAVATATAVGVVGTAAWVIVAVRKYFLVGRIPYWFSDATGSFNTNYPAASVTGVGRGTEVCSPVHCQG